MEHESLRRTCQSGYPDVSFTHVDSIQPLGSIAAAMVAFILPLLFYDYSLSLPLLSKNDAASRA
jgi:hypothetical protein